MTVTNESDAPGTRPRRVTIAVAALSVALGLGAAILTFAWQYPVVALVTLAVVGLLIAAVARGRNWARWTLTVFTIVGLVSTWPVVRFQLGYGVLLPLATATQLVLEALGLLLLFGPSAGRWFRRRGRAAHRAAEVT
jgi:hypothetical protein